MANQSCSNCCQFWSETNKRCTVSSNGLFIPQESHIITYCTSEKHTECRLFREEMHLRQTQDRPSLRNRRKYPRLPSQYPINLRYLHATGDTIGHASGMADTIDISAGGMRISTRKPLFSETLVRFSYGRGAPMPRREGIAKVAWCAYRQDIMKYLVGLRFHDSPLPASTPLEGKPKGSP